MNLLNTQSGTSNNFTHWCHGRAVVKASLFLVLTVSFLSTAGCNTKFGVEEEVWKTLDEDQKDKVINEYYEQQKQEKQIEKTARKARELREKRMRKSLGKDAYFPDKVIYGKLFGGRFRHEDEYHRFEPVFFSIAYGEIKPIRVKLDDGKCYTCFIEYADGKFRFDVSPYAHQIERNRARVFKVKEEMKSGVHVPAFATSDVSPLDGEELHLNLQLKTNER